MEYITDMGEFIATLKLLTLFLSLYKEVLLLKAIKGIKIENQSGMPLKKKKIVDVNIFS